MAAAFIAMPIAAYAGDTPVTLYSDDYFTLTKTKIVQDGFYFIYYTGMSIMGHIIEMSPSPQDFANGYLLVWNGTDKYGLVDGKGKLILPPIYDRILLDSPEKPLIGVVIENNCGFADTTGNIVIPLEYEYDPDAYYLCFRNGLALVKKNGLYGFIDESGKIAIPLIYSDASSFDEHGFARVKKETGGDAIYIDNKGNEYKTEHQVFEHFSYEYDQSTGWISKWTAVFDNHVSNTARSSDTRTVNIKETIDIKESKIEWNAHMSVWRVQHNGKFGALDVSTGKLIVPIEYDELTIAFEDDKRSVKASDKLRYVIARQGDKYGFYDENARLLLPVKYDSLYVRDSGLVNTGSFKSPDGRRLYILQADEQIIIIDGDGRVSHALPSDAKYGYYFDLYGYALVHEGDGEYIYHLTFTDKTVNYSKSHLIRARGTHPDK